MPAPSAKTAIENSNDFHRLMGECLVRWQSIEHMTYLLFQHMTQCRSNAIGSLIFFHIRASDQKINLCDLIACDLLRDPDLAQWKTLLPRIRASSSMRDRIAHFNAVTVIDNNEQDYELRPVVHDIKNWNEKAKGKHVNRKQLKNFSADLHALNQDLNQFRLALWKTLGKPKTA